MIKFKSVFIHHISLLKIKSKTTFLYFQAAGSWSPYIQRKVGNSEPPEVIFFRKEMSAFGSDHYILRLLGVKCCDIGLLTSSEAKVGNSEPKEVICLRNKHEHWNLQPLVGHQKNGGVQQIF